MIKFPLKSISFLALFCATIAIHPANAGDDKVRTEAYFYAIAARNAEAITAFYADDAEFRWIGGPLAGTYKGKDNIKAVWENFTRAAGSFTHEVLDISESTDGKGVTVTARVKFKGETEVAVKFLLAFKDGKIANETGQVDKPVALAEAGSKIEARLAASEPVPTPVTVAKAEPQILDAPAKTPAIQAPTVQTSSAVKADYLPKGALAPAKASSKAAATPSENKPTENKAAPAAKSAENKATTGKKRNQYSRDYDSDGGARYGYDDGYHHGYGGYGGHGGGWHSRRGNYGY